MGAYAVSDTSAAILAAATTSAVTGATEVSLTDPTVAVTVASAETLTGLGNFMGAYAISDTSAAILAASGSSTITGATEVSLVDPAVGVTVADAEALTGLSNFAGTYALTDSLANLEAESAQPIVAGASGYSLTNPAGSLGIVSTEQQTLVAGASNASDFTFTVVSIAPSGSTVNEGSALTFTVNLSEAQATDTTVQFNLIAGDATASNQGTDLTNLNDFGTGIFNPFTVTIAAGQTSATFDYTPFADGLVELLEGFSVQATVDGILTISSGAQVLDATIDEANTFLLTTGVDTATSNNFLAVPVAGLATSLQTLNSGDSLKGVGVDPTLTLLWDNASLLGASNTILPSMDKVETFNVTNVGNSTLTILSTNVTGILNLNISDSTESLRMTNLQSKLETISISRNFESFPGFGDFANAQFTIADKALEGIDDTLAITLDQVLGGELAIGTLTPGNSGYEKASINSILGSPPLPLTVIDFENILGVAGIRGLQELTVTGNQNLILTGSLAPGFTTLDASAFTANFTAQATNNPGSIVFKGGSGVDTFTIFGDGNHNLTGNDGDDSFNVFANGNQTFDGGLGNDFITVNGNGNGIFTGGEGDDIATVFGDGNQTFDGGLGNDFITVNGNGDGIFTGGEGNDTVTVFGNGDGIFTGGEGDDFVTVFGDGKQTFDGGLGNDSFTVNGNGNHDLTGGEGNDTFTSTGTGNVKFIGDAGDDSFTFNDGFTKLDVIDGGDGINTLNLVATEVEALNVLDKNVTNIQTLELSTPGTANKGLRADFVGTSVNVVTLEAGTQGAYNIRFNAGANTLKVLGNTNGTLTTSANGVATTDNLKLVIDGTLIDGKGVNNLVLQNLTLSGIEQLTIDSINAFVDNNPATLDKHTIGAITLPLGSNNTVTITGNSTLELTGMVTANAINASALTGGASLQMMGGRSNFDNPGVSINITGSAGNDFLNGSETADVYNGGAGSDTFSQDFNSTGAALASTSGANLTADATFTLKDGNADILHGADIILNFEVAGDFLQTGQDAGSVTNLVIGGGIAANNNYAIRGDYVLSAGVAEFKTNLGSGADVLVFTATAGADPLLGLSAVDNLGKNFTVLQGIGGSTLTGANFV